MKQKKSFWFFYLEVLGATALFSAGILSVFAAPVLLAYVLLAFGLSNILVTIIASLYVLLIVSFWGAYLEY